MKTNEQIAEANGWTIECESPLELRHIDGSFATGQAADVLLQAMPEMYPEEEEPEGMKAYYFHFDSGHIGGCGVVIAESRQEGYKLALEQVKTTHGDWSQKVREPFEEDNLILVDPNTCVIINDGDY